MFLNFNVVDFNPETIIVKEGENINNIFLISFIFLASKVYYVKHLTTASTGNALTIYRLH